MRAGCAGLQPTVAAIKARKDICLANKETLIAGGPYVLPLAKEYGVKILPADSEHSVRYSLALYGLCVLEMILLPVRTLFIINPPPHAADTTLLVFSSDLPHTCECIMVVATWLLLVNNYAQRLPQHGASDVD